MGVPLIPDRAWSRSRPTRWSGGRSDAIETRRRILHGTCAVSVAVLAVAIATGAVPVPAAAAVVLLVPAAAIDVDHRRLPDAWVASSLIVLLVALALESALGRPIDSASTMSGAAGGAVLMAVPILTLHLVSPASMGFGDVKASVVLGAAVGTVDWRLGAVALSAAALTGAAAGVATRRRTIAFGPFLVGGAIFALLAHERIVDAVFTGGITP